MGRDGKMSWWMEAVLFVSVLFVLNSISNLHRTLEECLEELVKIREGIADEYSGTGKDMKFVSWGLKGIGEGIRRDLEEIRAQIREK
jgi:hypothetical protein